MEATISVEEAVKRSGVSRNVIAKVLPISNERVSCQKFVSWLEKKKELEKTYENLDQEGLYWAAFREL